MSRAERRHKLEVIKKKVKKYYGGYAKAPKQIGKLANTRTPCSCSMCANKRKLEGPTLQERRHNEKETL